MPVREPSTRRQPIRASGRSRPKCSHHADPHSHVRKRFFERSASCRHSSLTLSRLGRRSTSSGGPEYRGCEPSSGNSMRYAPRGKLGPEDESHDGPEAGRGGEADKVEPTNAALETAVEHGSPGCRGYPVSHRLIQKG